MLIYVNNFKLDVDNATERALQSVCGWIKYKTHNSFTTDMLKSSGNFKFLLGMNKEKAVYYQPTCWLTVATDYSFLCACHKRNCSARWY